MTAEEDRADALRDASQGLLRETILGAHLEKHALEQAGLTSAISEVQKRSDHDRLDHTEKHKTDQTAIEKAMDNEQRRLAEHQVTHEAAHDAHSEKHESDKEALETALASEQRRLAAHREAHDAAHAAHEALHDNANITHKDQHVAEYRAVEAAQASMDKRLDTMNEFRDQLRDQAATFVRREALEVLDSYIDRRYEELRSLIGSEREERRANEGNRQGVSGSLGWIIAALGAAATIISIVVVLSNVLTTPP